MDLDKREQLDVDGFCIILNWLPPALLARIQAESMRILEALPKEHEQDNRPTGSMMSVYESPVFAELIVLPEAQAALLARAREATWAASPAAGSTGRFRGRPPDAGAP